MCFGCSKEPSHWDGSFENPQHMFWMRNEENNFPIRTLIWRPESLWIQKRLFSKMKTWHTWIYSTCLVLFDGPFCHALKWVNCSWELTLIETLCTDPEFFVRGRGFQDQQIRFWHGTNLLLDWWSIPAFLRKPIRERSGSVVECLIWDRRAAGSSLTGVMVLWSLSKTHLS